MLEVSCWMLGVQMSSFFLSLIGMGGWPDTRHALFIRARAPGRTMSEILTRRQRNLLSEHIQAGHDRKTAVVITGQRQKTDEMARF